MATTATRTRAKKRTRRGGRRTQLPVVPLVFAFLVVAGIVAMAVTAGGVGQGGGPATAPVEVEGDALPPAGEGADAAVGAAAPQLDGQSLEGTPTAITDDGRPKVVVFVAHWCPACQNEVPAVQSWVDAGGLPDDVDLYAVVTGSDRTRPNFPPSAWLEREGWSSPTVVDDDRGSAAEAYGLTGYPFFVFVDADGTVVDRHLGPLGIEPFEQAVAALR